MAQSAENGAPAAGRLEVETFDESPRRVALKGELDLATVPIAQERLDAEREQPHLVLDLRELRFLDSSGLRLVLSLSEGERPEKLTIVRGPDQVDRVFELTGAASRLDLVDEPSQTSET